MLVRPKDWLEAIDRSSGLGAGDEDRLRRSVAYCRAAWAAAVGYDGFAAGAGRDEPVVVGVELAVDDAVFVRRGGGTGGGALLRGGAADVSLPPPMTDSVCVRDMGGDGSRSIKESVLAVEVRLGGRGGTGLRRIASCDGVLDGLSGGSRASAAPEAVRSADGLEGFEGGTRDLTGVLAPGVGFGGSSSSRRSIRSPLSRLLASASGVAGCSRLRRGGRAGLLVAESE